MALAIALGIAIVKAMGMVITTVIVSAMGLEMNLPEAGATAMVIIVTMATEKFLATVLENYRIIMNQ
jgi:hypothetical protein